MTKPKIVRDRSFYAMLLSIALPITLQNIISFLTQMIDTIMLGELGDIAMSASALANQPFFLLNSITFGLSGGAAVLTAQYWGKKDIEPIKVIMTMIIRFAMFVGLLFSIIVLIIPEQILWLFSKEQEVILAGVEYLRVIAFCYVFFGFSSCFFMMIRSVEIVKVSVVSNIVALVMNGVLNYILIFGHFGAPAMGIKGAALATLIARLSEFLVAFVYMFFIDKRLKIRIKDFFRFEKLLLLDLFSVSLPVVLNEMMWSIGTIMQAALLGNLGKEVVSANSIIGVVQQLANVAVFGVANAAAVLIGKAIGEGNMQEAYDRGYTFKILSMIFGVFVSIIILSLKFVAIDFYNVSAEAKALAHQLIYIAAIIGFFVSISGIGVVGILRGGGDTKFSLFIEAFNLLAIAVPCAYFVAFVLKWPIPAVYFVMRIDEPLKNVMLLKRLRGSNWLRNVTRDNLDL
jgi:putative MATE family efflux protein